MSSPEYYGNSTINRTTPNRATSSRSLYITTARLLHHPTRRKKFFIDLLIIFSLLITPLTGAITYPISTVQAANSSNLSATQSVRTGLGSTLDVGKSGPLSSPSGSKVSPAAPSTSRHFPSSPASSLAFDISGTWNTRAWSTTNPPGFPTVDFSGFITLHQVGLSLTGNFTVTNPSSLGILAGSINDQGAAHIVYTVTTGIFTGRIQVVDAQVLPTGLTIQGAWIEYYPNGQPTGYSGVYYGFNQQIETSARPVERQFGVPGDICGHENGCSYSLDPVNLATGNAVWQETDLDVPAPGTPLVWWRTYNSRDTQSRAMGQGWSLSYDARLDLSTSGQVTAINEDGARSIYTISGTQYLRRIS